MGKLYSPDNQRWLSIHITITPVTEVSCLAADEDDSVRHLLGVMSGYGGWPMIAGHWAGRGFNWQIMLADLIREMSVSPIISIYVYVDRKESSRSVLTVGGQFFCELFMSRYDVIKF